MSDVGAMFLDSARARFRATRHLADRAIQQVDDKNLHRALDEHTNSIAVIMKHMAGNMISRWTDFLTRDGEKPDRNRDEEFVDAFSSRSDVQACWDQGWQRLLSTIDALKPEDLTRVVTIRGEPHTVIDAIHRQLEHYGYHAGQIVQLARHWAGDAWTVLTVPRGPGESEAHNRRTWKQ